MTQDEFRTLAEAVSDLETQLKKLEVRIGECLAAKAKQGLQGKQGLRGEQGLPGKNAVVDHERIAAEIVKQLPPQVVHLLDGEGNVAAEITAKLGEPILIPAQRLRTMDEENQQLQETTAPLGEPLGLRFKPVKAK